MPQPAEIPKTLDHQSNWDRCSYSLPTPCATLTSLQQARSKGAGYMYVHTVNTAIAALDALVVRVNKKVVAREMKGINMDSAG